MTTPQKETTMLNRIISWFKNFVENFDEFCALNDIHEIHDNY